MNLRSKLFYSHLLVMIVSILVVALSAGLISSLTFQEITTEETTLQAGSNFLAVEEDTFDVTSAMDVSLLIGLGSAMGISTCIAFIISLSLSRRMVFPIREMIKATQRITEGNYDQRVVYRNQDEIGELAQHFNDMAQSLEKTEVTRRELLADLTHEFNTPLSSIVGCVEGLQDGTITDSDKSYLVIQDEARRLQRLVHDVQHLSSVEAGVYSQRQEPISVSELLQAVSEKLAIQFESKPVELIVNYPPKALMIHGDRDRVIRVLINLLGNALQYTSSGGQVTASANVMDDKVKFIIADTGIGIVDTDLKQIFNRFYRVEKSRNRRSGGSGIGLTIARHIVEAHGGCIWAESDGIGQGSHFHFTLPISPTL